MFTGKRIIFLLVTLLLLPSVFAQGGEELQLIDDGIKSSDITYVLKSYHLVKEKIYDIVEIHQDLWETTYQGLLDDYESAVDGLDDLEPEIWETDEEFEQRKKSELLELKEKFEKDGQAKFDEIEQILQDEVQPSLQAVQDAYLNLTSLRMIDKEYLVIEPSEYKRNERQWPIRLESSHPIVPFKNSQVIVDFNQSQTGNDKQIDIKQEIIDFNEAVKTKTLSAAINWKMISSIGEEPYIFGITGVIIKNGINDLSYEFSYPDPIPIASYRLTGSKFNDLEVEQIGQIKSVDQAPAPTTQAVTPTTTAPAAKPAAKLKVGMVTDAGTIDDKSFNQGTWEGILKAQTEGLVEAKYLKPSGTTEADYLKEIGNLYDAGYKFIILPGYKFETALFVAQDKYKDAKFVILDGEPHSADYSTYRIEPNVAAVYWEEHESGFLAGVAAALQIKEGEFGFIGGMEIPAVQKFNWGWQQGVKYANENLGTKIVMKQENNLYQGSFDNVAAGQQIAASMYDKGVKVIFAVAGGVGVGAINETKARVTAGKDVWIVGVDVDQYADGLLPSGKSVILTSAMKYLDRASYDMIKAELAGTFPGGKILRFSAANNGLGIPPVNSNLSAEVQAKVSEISQLILKGEIKVFGELQPGMFK